MITLFPLANIGKLQLFGFRFKFTRAVGNLEGKIKIRNSDMHIVFGHGYGRKSSPPEILWF